ncbi:hypothetical protein NDU88_000642 [Pleurodeles waltl]|uniref:Secreted protein n=1 Tax=Pleurodeles waltl TaxID=8319 RepID=A0AAV7S7K4_PLEWA|nr:hypothetical protein NDU88_000642 [Pleurodeles waltl]
MGFARRGYMFERLAWAATPCLGSFGTCTVPGVPKSLFTLHSCCPQALDLGRLLGQQMKMEAPACASWVHLLNAY